MVSWAIGYTHTIASTSGVQDTLLPSRKTEMFEPAWDMWSPNMYRSPAANAIFYQQCTYSCRNLKILLPKAKLGQISKPREPKECLDLDFWVTINHFQKQQTYVLVATDRFSIFLSAMVTTTNTAVKVISFLENYLSQHGVPRKTRRSGIIFHIKQVQKVLKY